MAEHVDEHKILRIPKSAVSRFQGCGLDFGGSLMKVAYATEEDEFVKVHFIAKTYDSKEYLMNFLSDTIIAHVRLDGGVYAAGVGSAQMAGTLLEIFKTSSTIPETAPVQNPSEFFCFVKAIQFLSRIQPLDKLVYPKRADKIQEGRDIGSANKQFRKIFSTASDEDDTDFERPSTPNTLYYPTLLYMCGSAGVPIKMYENWKFQWLSHNYCGGKHLLAMGGVMTGAKTFEEFLQLAAAGDSHAVDTCGLHSRPKSQSPLSSSIPDECRMYKSGQLMGKTLDEVKPEDMAASMMYSVADVLSQDALLWANMADCKQILFIGSLNEHAIFRDLMTLHMEQKLVEITKNQVIDYQFMEFAGFLGAFGALLMGLE